MCVMLVNCEAFQANTWSFQLGLSRSYEIIAPMLDEETALEFVESDVRVVITDSQDGPSSLKTRNISLPMFCECQAVVVRCTLSPCPLTVCFAWTVKEFDRLQVPGLVVLCGAGTRVIVLLVQALVHQQERAGSGRGGSDRLPGEGLLALGDGTSRPGSARVGRTTRPASALSSRTTSVSGSFSFPLMRDG
jgi:hypothetical protein